MKKKLLRGVLVDVENEKAGVVEIQDELDEFYRILNCDCIDITVRRIGRNNRYWKKFNIVCDDEGLFKDPQKISAIDNLGRPQLVGNLFIVSGCVDSEGNLLSLSEDDAAYILDLVQKMCTRNFPAGYPMLTQCEY